MSHIRGKNAIVTGAAVGLGNAYARALAAAGANVAVCDVLLEVSGASALDAAGAGAGWTAVHSAAAGD